MPDMDEEPDQPQVSEFPGAGTLAFRYPADDLRNGIRRICAGRSVHVARAASINQPDLLCLPLDAGARRLILSDMPHKAASCAALAERLRDLHPEAEIVALALDHADFWQCRAAPKSEVVMDLGRLIHDVAPDLVLRRLSQMTTDTLFVATMVLPSFEGPADAAFPDGRILPADRLRPPSAIAEGAAMSFGRRGMILAQLNPDAYGPFAPPLPDAWRWFFSADGLNRLGHTLGLATVCAFHTWHDLAIAIEFRRQ